MKSPSTQRAVTLVLSVGLLAGAQLAARTGGVKYPNAEPVISVDAEGDLAFSISEADTVGHVKYVIYQTDFDTFGARDRRYDMSCAVHSLITRSMLFDERFPSRRGVNEKYQVIWDVVGTARGHAGVYRDQWEAYNKREPKDATYDSPVKLVRIVELRHPFAPKSSKPGVPVVETGGKMPPPDKDEDDRLSDELKKGLSGLLTADEHAQLKGRQEVEVPFERLTPELRKQADRYRDLRWALGWGPLDGKIALRRGDGLKLWLSPISTQLIGINGKLTDGRSVFF